VSLDLRWPIFGVPRWSAKPSKQSGSGSPIRSRGPYPGRRHAPRVGFFGGFRCEGSADVDASASGEGAGAGRRMEPNRSPRIGKRIACHEKVGDHHVAGERRIS
jgi:hypothetical protein